MPLEYTPVSNLNSSKQEWKIRVLMSRAWTFHPQDKPNFILGMEVILVDEQGDRIQASVKTKLVKKFKNQLKEGEFRDIMNFEVLENNGDYRGTTHPFKIAFLFNTYLKPCDHIPNISRFNFCSFGEIESQSNTDDVFIDILGEVVAMSGVKEKNVANNPSKLLEIFLHFNLFLHNSDFIFFFLGKYMRYFCRDYHI
uniref:Replication protein A 70 kDa DNA-binding subunit B/D first OB fold domain-containing protein n=1 Tax=Noccaea caerulescens TaxID=107243 RepID=A0A1J3IC83_NOCCA